MNGYRFSRRFFLVPVVFSRLFFLVILSFSFLPLGAFAQRTALTRVSYASYKPTSSEASFETSRGASAQSGAEPSPILDARFLEEIATRFNIPVAPVYAFEASEMENDGAEVLGVREGMVWDVRVSGKLMALRKVGSMVAAADARLRALEASVVGSRVLLAYEGLKGELVAVLQSGAALYSARRLEDKSIAIARISPDLD